MLTCRCIGEVACDKSPVLSGELVALASSSRRILLMLLQVKRLQVNICKLKNGYIFERGISKPSLNLLSGSLQGSFQSPCLLYLKSVANGKTDYFL